MAAIWRGCKQYAVEFTSDRYDCCKYNRETDDYGTYEHEAGRASSLKSAKAIISKARKEYAADNARNFKVYDCWAEGDEFAPCVFFAE